MKYFSRQFKQNYFKVGLFACLALLLCAAQPVRAELISASATIDWSTFKITPIDTGNGLPSLIWNNQDDYSRESLFFRDSVDETASNWSTGTSVAEIASESTVITSASASTSVNEIKADASISGSIPNPLYLAESSSQRYGNFTVQGNGRLLFQANYNLAAEANSSLGISASSHSLATFSLSSSSNAGDVQAFSKEIFGGSSALTETGVFSAALDFQDGSTGNFGTFVKTEISSFKAFYIPLPPAFWLFGSSLAGIIALRRKISASLLS